MKHADDVVLANQLQRDGAMKSRQVDQCFRRRSCFERASSRAFSRPRIRLLRFRRGFVEFSRFLAFRVSLRDCEGGLQRVSTTWQSLKSGSPSISIITSPLSIESTAESKRSSVAASRSIKSHSLIESARGSYLFCSSSTHATSSMCCFDIATTFSDMSRLASFSL